ncbi:MAG: cell wall-active antibiotics response protein LiaF [Dehalococcoidia bacterium]|nr:cell wall-active antibiotics response protein LiaF [Dehalococcoidia bacterium]
MTTTPDQPESTGPAPETPPAETSTAGPPPRRRLMRSRDDEMIAGVAGGIAEYFDLDPVLVRVAFVVLALVTSGTAIIAYIIAWIVMPEAGAGDSAARAAIRADGTAEPRPRRSSGAAAGIVWGVILISVGTMVLLSRLDITLPEWNVVLSGGLILLGVLIILEARRGLNGGLVTLAVALSVILGAAAFVDFRFDSGFGDRQVVVTRVADLDDSYSHAFGSMTVDLRNLEVAEGQTKVSVSVAFGDVTVRLPAGVPYRINANSAFGSVDAPEFDADGIAVERSYRSEGYDQATRRVEIDVSVAFGSARVR